MNEGTRACIGSGLFARRREAGRREWEKEEGWVGGDHAGGMGLRGRMKAGGREGGRKKEGEDLAWKRLVQDAPPNTAVYAVYIKSVNSMKSGWAQVAQPMSVLKIVRLGHFSCLVASRASPRQARTWSRRF
jgi:hypothetical protein